MRRFLTGGVQISILVAKNLMLSMFMFKMMEYCSKPCNMKHFNSREELVYQHQWKLEQRKTDDLNVPKIDKNNCAKTMENIVLHLKLMREMRSVPFSYVVRHPGYTVYMNLDVEMIARALTVNTKSNLKQT